MQYLDIIFMQGGNDEVMDMLDRYELDEAVEYLKQWESEYNSVRDEQSHGSDDDVYVTGDYIMSYNLRLGYVGLIKKLSQLNPEGEAS